MKRESIWWLMKSLLPCCNSRIFYPCEHDLFLQIPWNMNHDSSCRKETFLKVFISAMASRLPLQSLWNLMGLQGQDGERLSASLTWDNSNHSKNAFVLLQQLSSKRLTFLQSRSIFTGRITGNSRSIRQRGKFTCCSLNSLITEDVEFDGRLVSGIKEEVICSTANSFLINFSNWSSSTHYLFKLLRLIL